jgi:hypothetical protein
MDAGLAGILGTLLGFATSSIKDAIASFSKGKKFEIALQAELNRAIRTLDEKMSWLERPLPAGMVEKLSHRIVAVDGKPLYLGEKEALRIPYQFWSKNYPEIVVIVSAKSFRRFSSLYDCLQRFETKFADMKYAFECSDGDSKVMALACYRDLKQIQKEIQELKRA